MADNFTAEEQAAVAAYLARGGTITRRDVVMEGGTFVARVSKVRADGEVVSSEIVDYCDLAPKHMRDVIHASAEAGRSGVRRRTRAQKQQDMELKAAQQAERRRRAEVGRAIMAEIHRKKAAERLGRILRQIGGEWTHERLKLVADAEKTSTKRLRAFLRKNGHGDSLPRQAFHNGSTADPRNALIRADHEAGMSLSELRAKWGFSTRTISMKIRLAGGTVSAGVKRWYETDAARANEVIDAYNAMMPIADIAKKWATSTEAINALLKFYGVPKRSKLVVEKGPGYAAKLAERDQQIRADYEAGTSMDDIRAKWKLGNKAVLEAVYRAGGSRRPQRLRGLAKPNELDRQLTAAYQEGDGAGSIGKRFGVSEDRVFKALDRCGVPHRSKSEARYASLMRSGFVDRMAEVLRLHSQGVSLRQIAARVGFGSHRTVKKIIYTLNQQGAAQ